MDKFQEDLASLIAQHQDVEELRDLPTPITTTGTPTRITWSIKTGTGTSTYPNGTVFIKE